MEIPGNFWTLQVLSLGLDVEHVNKYNTVITLIAFDLELVGTDFGCVHCNGFLIVDQPEGRWSKGQ